MTVCFIFHRLPENLPDIWRNKGVLEGSTCCSKIFAVIMEMKRNTATTITDPSVIQLQSTRPGALLVFIVPAPAQVIQMAELPPQRVTWLCRGLLLTHSLHSGRLNKGNI
ncbi:hypothetical protein AMECASPLE_036108 [Ameca splendens]|uniref:Uncharacterized protein n=1 Tax=Ameca splendens TaxID=208324 RepID=A0ABV0XWV5_9TELE